MAYDIYAERSKNALSVQELIDELSKVEDKSLLVWADGCDCTNPVIGSFFDGRGITLRIDT